MLKAALDLSVFLHWRSACDDAAETQAGTNLQFELKVNLHMLTSFGWYTDPVSQSIICLYAYCQQVSNLAFKALKHYML